jgi:hypothetical protein
MKRIAILLTLLSGIAFGQVATRFDGVAQTTRSINGNTLLVPSPNASVTICTYPATGGLPCTNKASVCPDSTGVGCTTGSPNNPIQADAQGNFGFWALPGTYQYSVCPVSGVCRGPYNASVPFTGTGTVTGNVTGQSGSTLVDATQDKGFVNAVSDCSVPSDRVSDIAASLNACILANPGKKILLPKLAAGSTQDYFSSTTILVKGLGTLLVGGGTCGNWGRGSVLIQFASGVAGIRRDTDNEDGGLECLSAVGGDAFCGNACSTAAALATYEDFSSESALQGTSGADGIQVLAKGHQWWVTATFFKRHGFLFNGNSVGQPDLVSNVGLLASFNRGYGYYTYGTDANVMVFTSLNNWYNAMGGIKDSSFYGNTWIGPHSSGNAAFLGASAGPNKTIAAANGLVVASNVLTITTTTAHGWSAGMWITTTGSTDTSYNGTCKLLTVPLTTTATCSFTHADGNTANGTAATSSSAQVKAYYVAASLVVGSYVSTSTAGSSTFVTPYSESTSGASVWGGALVLNPQGIDGGGSAGSATGHKIIGSSNGNIIKPAVALSKVL